MAIDTCSERSTPNTSPRISFSFDIDSTNPRCQTSPQDSFSGTFDFFFENSIEIEPSSSADELFSQGLIKPKQIEKSTSMSNNQTSPLSMRNHIDLESSKVVITTSESKSVSKSFWRIKRSTSLRSETSYNKKSSFWSLPPLLSRSSSMPNYTKLRSKKDNNNQSLNNKDLRFSITNVSTSQKPPLKKKNNGVRYNSNGVRISPMINGPPPIISTNLFGFGSLFSNGKDKKVRK